MSSITQHKKKSVAIDDGGILDHSIKYDLKLSITSIKASKQEVHENASIDKAIRECQVEIVWSW